MAEHVDFELEWATGEDVGFKLVAINVSDIAAMGGRPTNAVATIQLGDETELDLVEAIARGIAEAAGRWEISVVGGDIGRGTDLALTMTLLGAVDGRPVLRSAAHVGDTICVTGTLGAAHAGLLLLQLGAVDRDAVAAEIATASGADGLAVLAAAQLRPHPRTAEGRALRGYASAMIDISDGFAIDLERLCAASGVGCQIDSTALPIHPELQHAADKVERFPQPFECAVLGGEDFELLFTVPEGDMDRVVVVMDEIGTSVSVVGKISDGDCTMDGRPLQEWSHEAWDHLRIQ
jgi:thiamine-monophosphate kinase